MQGDAKEVEVVENSDESVNADQSVSADAVDSSVVDDPSVSSDDNSPSSGSDIDYDAWPDSAKKRIGKKNKYHRRELDSMKYRLEEQMSINAQLASAAPHSYQEQQAQAGYEQPQQGVDQNSVQYQVAAEFKRREDEQNYQVAQQRQVEQQQVMDDQTNRLMNDIDDASDRYPDFDDVVRRDDLPITQTMVEVAKLSPNGADLLYFLGKNPKEVTRISKLKDYHQAREVMKHMVNLNSKGGHVSKAPPPVSPLGNGDVSSAKSASRMSYSELKQRDRDKQSRGRHR